MTEVLLEPVVVLIPRQTFPLGHRVDSSSVDKKPTDIASSLAAQYRRQHERGDSCVLKPVQARSRTERLLTIMSNKSEDLSVDSPHCGSRPLCGQKMLVPWCTFKSAQDGELLSKATAFRVLPVQIQDLAIVCEDVPARVAGELGAGTAVVIPLKFLIRDELGRSHVARASHRISSTLRRLDSS